MTLVQEVLNKLGVTSSPDSTVGFYEDLCAALTARWGYCSVPKVLFWYDNSRFGGEPLSLDPRSVWEFYLEHGVSDTCYGTSWAVKWLLDELGLCSHISGWRLVGAAPTSVDIDHMTNMVEVAGDYYMLETSVPYSKPVKVPSIGMTQNPEEDFVAASDGFDVTVVSRRAGASGLKRYDLVEWDVGKSTILEHIRLAASTVDPPKLMVTKMLDSGHREVFYDGEVRVIEGPVVVSSTKFTGDALEQFLRETGMSDRVVAEVMLTQAA